MHSAALLLTVVLTSGCFAELAAGVYKSSGSTTESEFIIGFNAGVYLEYSRFVRVAAGGDAMMPLGSGEVRQRSYGTTLKGDVTVIGDPKNRLRLSGGLQFGQGGDTKVEIEGQPVMTGDVETSGWFAGLTFETTTKTAQDRVTQSYTLGPHFMTSTSDVIGERKLSGVQLRINHTFWPTYRRVSPGFFGALANAFVNNTVGGTGDGADPSQGPTGACAPNTERVLSFGGYRTRTTYYCN